MLLRIGRNRNGFDSPLALLPASQAHKSKLPITRRPIQREDNVAFTARRLPNEPIIVVTWSPPIEDPGDEVPRMCREVDRLIGNDKKVWNIQDMREFKVNFSTAVKGMSQVSIKSFRMTGRQGTRPLKKIFLHILSRLSEPVLL